MSCFKKLLLPLLLLISSVSMAATKIPVVTSFSILGDIVSNIGGDRVAVTTLVGTDEDAHVYAATPKDVRTLTQAKLMVVNGLGFEGWMQRLTDAANYKGMLIVASDGVPARKRVADANHGHEHEGDAASDLDPHAWQDPSNVMIYTRNIVAALSKVDPAGAAVYQKNGEAYLRALTELDTWAKAQFGQIPEARRSVITSHDAFEYFGSHFKIRFLAAQGVSTDSEPSARDVAMLIRQMRQQKIKALFFENMSNPKLLQQIANETGVTPGGKLYADALSKADGNAPTYLRMMRFNVEQILAGLKKNQ